MIPLILRLKKARHKEIAKAQDLIVEGLYNVFNNAVLHGGTAIWRCYKGNRFSEDVDVYLTKNNEKLNILFSNLEKKGFLIEKKKISANSLYSNLIFNGTAVRFEALFKPRDRILKEYETAEGNFITVYTLSAEELIKEKVAAYLKRLRIRDLYDVFFLLRYADKSKVRQDIKKLSEQFNKPLDEQELKVLILEGLTPSAEKMLQYIKSFA
jgi:predicted nucleotidyltransferase component of viral defense system